MKKIKAQIYLFMYSGRRSPIKSDYRPAFSFDNKTFYTGHIELINQDFFELGTSNEVFVSFIDDKVIKEYLKTGVCFSINEPPNMIGEGKIIEVID